MATQEQAKASKTSPVSVLLSDFVETVKTLKPPQDKEEASAAIQKAVQETVNSIGQQSKKTGPEQLLLEEQNFILINQPAAGAGRSRSASHTTRHPSASSSRLSKILKQQMKNEKVVLARAKWREDSDDDLYGESPEIINKPRDLPMLASRHYLHMLLSSTKDVFNTIVKNAWKPKLSEVEKAYYEQRRGVKAMDQLMDKYIDQVVQIVAHSADADDDVTAFTSTFVKTYAKTN